MRLTEMPFTRWLSGRLSFYNLRVVMDAVRLLDERLGLTSAFTAVEVVLAERGWGDPRVLLTEGIIEENVLARTKALDPFLGRRESRLGLEMDPILSRLSIAQCQKLHQQRVL